MQPHLEMTRGMLLNYTNFDNTFCPLTKVNKKLQLRPYIQFSRRESPSMCVPNLNSLVLQNTSFSSRFVLLSKSSQSYRTTLPGGWSISNYYYTDYLFVVYIFILVGNKYVCCLLSFRQLVNVKCLLLGGQCLLLLPASALTFQ